MVDKKLRGKGRKTRKLEEGSGDECGVCKTNMTQQWMQTGQCQTVVRTSMVKTVLYSGCAEAAVLCSPYCTCIQYGSDAPTARISKHQIHHGEITNNKTTINKNDKTTMHKLTRNEREQDRGRERS